MRKTKEEIVKLARARFNSWGLTVPPAHSCLYWAAAIIGEAGLNGVRLSLQAGSASFLMVPPHLDDGNIPTHFSYQWDDKNSVVRQYQDKNLLPEMHVWAADVENKEIVDLTTCFLPELCIKAGFRWHCKEPPDFLWSNTLPDGWVYRPNLPATKLAAQLITNAFQG